jgi:hypothetical protein
MIQGKPFRMRRHGLLPGRRYAGYERRLRVTALIDAADDVL